MTPAIRLSQLTKRYPLYSGQLAQVLGAFGLSRTPPSWKVALDDIDLSIARGEKVGVIGRNGSGKTTLLRLVMGQTVPTSGQLDINGNVQGLMQTGFGFHDDLSGIANVTNSLVYNGIPASDLDETVADIIDFVELGEFINHPLKTYSLGMRARLEFASATAIQPDVLVIDEVLGAGDGYFVTKCAERMRKLISNSTLMLVSHSLDQILQYCDRVVWLDGGRIVDDGPAHMITSAYQNFMAKKNADIQAESHNSTRAIDPPDVSSSNSSKVPPSILALGPPTKQSSSPSIVDCGFRHESSTFHAIETGDPLSVSLKVHARKPCNVVPVIFGATRHGALIFEASGAPVQVASEAVCCLTSRCFNIGVGEYTLVPALRDAASGEILSIGDRGLSLHMLPTNWSGPPLIHLAGKWVDEARNVELETKISAWV